MDNMLPSIPTYSQYYAPASDRPSDTRTADTTSIAFVLAAIQLGLTQLIYGQVTDFFGEFGETLRILIIILIVSISLVFSAICISKKMFFAGGFSIISILGIFYYTNLYSYNTNIPFTFSAGGEFFGYSLLASAALMIKERSLTRLMEVFFVICCAYAAFYLVATWAINIGVIDTGSALRAVRGADDTGRGDRIVISSIAVVFGIMFSLTNTLRNFKFGYLILLVVFSGVLIISSSRLITAIAFFIVAAYVIIRNANLINRGAFFAFALGALFSIYFVFYPEFNPYDYTNDISGQVRGISLFLAADLIQYYWVLGSGIAFGSDGYFALTGSKFFFPNDVGMIGILFSYGVLGTALYVALSYFSSNIRTYAVSHGFSRQMADALALTAATFILYSLQTPHFDSSAPAAPLAMIALALFIERRAANAARNPRYARHRQPATQYRPR